MRRGAIMAVVATLVAAIALAIVGQALAGSAPDPRPGDKVLGKRGGITYVSDTEHVADPDYTQALTACPNAGGKSRITGGGIRVAGIPANVSIKASRPLDLATLFGDDDLIVDDYWEASTVAPVDTPVTSYAICAKLKGLRYQTVQFPDQSSGERLDTGSCAGGRRVTGGGGFIATLHSRVTSMFPVGSDRWSVAALDANGGVGTTTLDFVCLKSRHLKTVAAKRKLPSNSADFKSVQCPGKSHVTGGGALLNGGPIPSLLTSSYPYDGKDGDKIPDDGWTALGTNEGTGPQKLKVFAICLG
ncbi:MAG: hypothetical protein U0R51_01685 [Solirubrobacterales bacterium]